MLNNPQPSLKQEVLSRFYFPLQGPLEICPLEYAGAAAPEGRIVLTCAPVFCFLFRFALSTPLSTCTCNVDAGYSAKRCVSAALRLHRAAAATLRSVNTLSSWGFSVWAGNKEADQT